jgi:uroporphyrinogen III methyltransferase/synthase
MSDGQARTDRPLGEKRIVITRAPEQSVELKAGLEELGATVLMLPAVRFSLPADTRLLDAAILSLAGFEWVVFTSANAVRFFVQRWAELDPERVATFHRAAVGPATAAALLSEDLVADVVSSEFRGLGLARELAPILKGKRVLLPRSDRARADFPRTLRDTGAEVTEVIAYHTNSGSPAPEVLDALKNGQVDVITFFSPSAVENTREMVGAEAFAQLGGSSAMAAVGPVTAAALREAGLLVAIEAEEATSSSVIAAIEKYLTARNGPVARLV